MKEQTDINKNLYSFQQKLFSRNTTFVDKTYCNIYKLKFFPKWNDDQCALCEKYITEEEIKHELNKMKINKSPGNDGLAKDF